MPPFPALSATRPPRPDAPPPGRVPVEFIGRARLLRDKIAAAHAGHEAAAEALISPFRPRPGWRPMPRRAMLDRLGRRWQRLPGLGRLRCVAKFAAGKLQIAEIRLAPSQIAMAAWGSEGELAVAILCRLIVVKPPSFSEVIVPFVHVGLHALARRLERSGDREDAAVLQDLGPLARSWRDTIGGDEFEIPAGSGKWIGAVMMAGETPVMVVRTYVG